MFEDVTNSDIEFIISTWIHDERLRFIFRKRLIDGWTYSQIADVIGLSERQTKRLYYKNIHSITKHLN